MYSFQIREVYYINSKLFMDTRTFKGYEGTNGVFNTPNDAVIGAGACLKGLRDTHGDTRTFLPEYLVFKNDKWEVIE